MATPAYNDDSQALPAYVDSPFLPPPIDTKSATQTVWIQDTDIKGLYRRRYILPADPLPLPTGQTPEPDSASPPTYSSTPTPLYTVKSHGRAPVSFSKQPDFTVYVGDGDSGPVVATGSISTSRLKSSIGDIRFFPRSSNSNEASSSTVERPTITVKEAGKKFYFIIDNQDLEWENTGPGEQAPDRPHAPDPVSPKPTGFLAKLKRKAVSTPALDEHLPKETKTMVLTSVHQGTGVKTKIATYTEMQPLNNENLKYVVTTPKYIDGHIAKMEIHDPFFTFSGASNDAGRELAVVSVVLLLEANRKRTSGNMAAMLSGGGGSPTIASGF